MNDTKGTNPDGSEPPGPPSGYLYVVPEQREADGITLAEVISTAFGSWKLIVLIAFVCAVAAAAFSYLVTPTYRAVTIISPVNQTGSAGALRSQFGGLAALAGIDLGSGGRDKEQALATLKSPGFAREFIVSQNLLPVMYPEKWDAASKSWKAGEKPPSLEVAVKRFTSSVRRVDEELRTGIITLSVEWYSPQLAARWANQLVERVNERMRLDATRNAERSIQFLNQELAKSPQVELRMAIFRLVEEQVNHAMLANVQREYAFRVIDPAVPPDMRVSPRRTMMVLIGGTLGGFIGLFVVFLRRALRKPG
jgi:uncharacterized protein involved in exopolysaccharide biosynthesis